MANRQTRILADEILSTTPDGYEEHLVTEIGYGKGGMNLFTYKTDPRGYSLRVRIVERRREMVGDHAVTTERFTMFNGGRRAFLQEAKAFSAKKLSEITAPADLVTRLRDTVLAECRREATHA